MSTSDALEIRNLVAKLALVADDGDPEEYGKLFAEDAVWEMRLPELTSKVTGRGDIRTKFQERVSSGFQGPASGKRHSVSTHWIDVQGDRAFGRCYMLVHVVKDGSPHPNSFTMYADEYVKTESGWLLSRRVITRG